MEKLLISACLFGSNCKYSGGNNALDSTQLAVLKDKYSLVPVCPETAGGLPTPRIPSERLGERVIARDGRDVTENFFRGAELALVLARKCNCGKALLKANSPSCGNESIYDGSFSGKLVPGDGVTAQILKENGIDVFTEENIDKLL